MSTVVGTIAEATWEGIAEATWEGIAGVAMDGAVAVLAAEGCDIVGAAVGNAAVGEKVFEPPLI